MIKIGSDFSGIGAFDFAVKRLNIPFINVFACDIDKYAKQSYLANHEHPINYFTDVYKRDIPVDSLDIYMTSPPCQAFSIAGKRMGKDDKRGVLFFNSLEFIETNKPRYFIFENVKGLVSHDNGKTFSEWVNLLGGKSVNGTQTMFEYPGSVPYHIYYTVLNTKDYNVPQNRERIFIVGIRDDKDNRFKWPKTEYLTRKLKDILENEVDSKYYLSNERIHTLINNDRSIGFTDTNTKQYSNCIISGYSKIPTDGEYIADYRTDEGLRIRENGISPCLTSSNKSETEPSRMAPLLIKNNTVKGYIEANEGDSVNLQFPESETRRGRVGIEVSQTIDTNSNMGVIQNQTIRRLTPRECLRLQDFPEEFKIVVSDSQAYKQAGNSITVKVLENILKELTI